MSPETPDPSLLDLIRQAFPVERPASLAVTGCEPDTFYIRQAYADRSWPELPDDVIDRHHDALFMLHPEPLAYYLPALLSRAVRDPNSAGTDPLLFFLTNDRFWTFMNRLSTEQLRACIEVAEHLLQFEPTGYDSERETLALLREALAERG